MKVCQIIGQPGAGKTTLATELIQAFCDMGLRVGSMKHTAHVHELDKPGKDSFLHRKAGACPVAMVTPEMAGIYLNTPDEIDPERLLFSLFSKKDVVVIEGWLSSPFPKMELFRPATNPTPLFPIAKNVMGILSDVPLTKEIRESVKQNKIRFLKRKEIHNIISLVQSFPDQHP